MRKYENRVWHPIGESDDNQSEVVEYSFHSLETLVWEFAMSHGSDMVPDINLADLYFFFCKCPILACKRGHSTAGGYAQRGKGKGEGKGKGKGKGAHGRGFSRSWIEH